MFLLSFTLTLQNLHKAPNSCKERGLEKDKLNITDETVMANIVFVGVLNHFKEFPAMGSISHIIPSAPPVSARDPFSEKEMAVTLAHEK